MEKKQLIGEIIRLQGQLVYAIGQYTSEAWMDLSLTIGQLKSLFFIDYEKSSNLKQLANALGTTPPNVTGIVDRLVERGLVSREENPDNRRMLILKTTENGKELLGKLRANRISRLSDILAEMSLDDISAMAQGLRALLKVEEGRRTNTRR